MQKDSLLVYSGGMDSTAMLYEYKNRIALAVTFDYGSKHNDIEYKYAKQNTEKLGIKHIKLDLKSFMLDFKSNLLCNSGEIPKGSYDIENMKKTVVPFRNGIMLSIASGIAESNGLKRVMIANHFGDHEVYPDCGVKFIQGFRKAVKYGTWDNIQIFAPYSKIQKRDIALRLRKKGVLLGNISYSCYEGKKIHCGECGTCIERSQALLGFDNTIYKINKKEN